MSSPLITYSKRLVVFIQSLLDVDNLVTAMMREKDDRSVASKESVDSKEALPTGTDSVCFWARLFSVSKSRYPVTN